MKTSPAFAVVASTLIVMHSFASESAPQSPSSAKDGVGVRVERDAKGWRLMKRGEKLFLRGAGGSQRLEELVALGGNAIRTWSVDQAEPVLDKAEKLGVSVMVGLWLAHPRHGFNYNDAKAVEEQLQKQISDVKRLKDHPAIMMWGIGNEVELGADGDRTSMWKEVNRVAREVKKVDPTRPTMLIVAEVNPEKVREIKQYCTDIDILGVNSYGGMDTAADRARRFGWDGPIAITEFGPRGWWEVPQTKWPKEIGGGVPIEPNSTEKADTYFSRYFAGIAENPNVIGSFAFLWGQKQECTHTWFGLFMPDGSRLGAADAMSFAWTGRWPADRCPRIWDVKVTGGGDLSMEGVAPGTKLTGSLAANDPDGDPVKFEWEVREESSDRKTGGDREDVPPVVPTEFAASTPSATEAKAVFAAPRKPGRYRLFMYVKDPKGNAATANVPFYVKAN